MMTSSRRMVVAQPANHGEGRSAEGAEGKTTIEGDIARDRGKEVRGKVEELQKPVDHYSSSS